MSSRTLSTIALVISVIGMLLVASISFFVFSTKKINDAWQASLESRLVVLEKALSNQLFVRDDISGKKETVEVVASNSADARDNDVSESDGELLSRIEELESQVEALQKSSGGRTTVINSANDGVKEFSIFLGSGDSSSTTWSDIDGLQAKIDLSKYSNIKEIRFEGSLSIVGGEARARLYNKTTSQPIVESEIMHNTNTATFKTSGNIHLQQGENLYVVQIRSSSGERAYLSGGRVTIIVD